MAPREVVYIFATDIFAHKSVSKDYFFTAVLAVRRPLFAAHDCVTLEASYTVFGIPYHHVSSFNFHCSLSGHRHFSGCHALNNSLSIVPSLTTGRHALFTATRQSPVFGQRAPARCNLNQLMLIAYTSSTRDEPSFTT